ncbi:sigma-70 family RNA polymerase sigma factor [Parabacteroides sp. OttesenSCG-928-N08]|nr:sigma-70 family RNA polymerase sigma factor [Parabacteroides sp. OttesenSCG-928-N08]
MEEQLLITGCRRGESWARKQIYEKYAPSMMSLCVRYVNDKETARDLMQDGFVKIFTKIHTYTGEGAFGGWIRRIFVTTALEYLRSKEVMTMYMSIDNVSNLMVAVDNSIMEQLSANDLMDCIGKLPPGYRTVFNMYAIEGYSHKEIAQMLGINESTSRTQFIRARYSLQKSVLSLMEKENARSKRS